MNTTPIKVRKMSAQQGIARLERSIARYERRYELSSAEMIKAVEAGSQRETAEIGQWMISYRALNRLRALKGGRRTIGTHTKAT